MLSSVTFFLSINISPLSGRISPAIKSIIVDFPEPDLPTIPIVSFFLIEKFKFTKLKLSFFLSCKYLKFTFLKTNSLFKFISIDFLKSLILGFKSWFFASIKFSLIFS